MFSSKSLRDVRPGRIPRLERLEDRTVLSTTSTPTHFLLLARPTVYAGAPANVLVVALDASNHRVRNYTGTVALTSTGSGDTLPGSYTFGAGDRGLHLFQVTFGTPNTTDTVTATDASNNLTGQVAVNVQPPQVATHFLVLTQPQVYAGSPSNVLVVALDASNHRVRGYSGTVQLTSSVSGDTLPANYTFGASDHGLHLFQVTFGAADTETLTATDTANSSLTGSVSVTVNPPQVATHFLILTRHHVEVGQTTYVLVAALDASNHLVRGYTGTVHFAGSDSNVTLPADYQFQASDNGFHFFPVTFTATGSETLTVSDTGNGSLTGTDTVTVEQAGRHHHWWF